MAVVSGTAPAAAGAAVAGVAAGVERGEAWLLVAGPCAWLGLGVEALAEGGAAGGTTCGAGTLGGGGTVAGA